MQCNALCSSKMRKQDTDVSRRLSGFDRHAWDAPHKNIPSCVLMWGCVLLIPKQQQNTFFIHQVHKNICRHSYSLSANPDSSHFCRCQLCKFWPNLPSLQSSCISYLTLTRLHDQNHPQFWFDHFWAKQSHSFAQLFQFWFPISADANCANSDHICQVTTHLELVTSHWPDWTEGSTLW